MEPVKRLEIVAPAFELNQVLEVLDKLGVSGYSVIRNVIGKGDRGRSDDELSTRLGNDYILTICTEEQALKVAKAVCPLLKHLGGICVISDAQWVKHDVCIP